MKNALLVKSGKKLTPGVIEKLECALGYALPPEYRQFLFEHNGGEPAPNAPCKFWVCLDLKWQDSIERFFSVALTKKYAYLPFVWRFDLDYRPRQLLPIAWAPSAGVVYLGLSHGLSGKVFFVCDAKVPSAVTPTSTDADILVDRGMIKVADSFQQFLEKLF